MTPYTNLLCIVKGQKGDPGYEGPSGPKGSRVSRKKIVIFTILMTSVIYIQS